MRTFPMQREGGVLLVEVLIALALFLAISTIIAQALSVGFVSEKASRSRAIATAALEESLTRVRASSEEHWDNIASLPRNTPYHMSTIAGHFIAASGTGPVLIDGTTYTLSFMVRDVARVMGGTTTPLALVATSSTQLDPGSLLIDGVVNWGSGDSLTLQSVMTRWRNIVCGQTSWDTSGSSTQSCESASVSLGSKNNIQVGDQLLLCSGC